MTRRTVEQALHGYDHGHQWLAGSVELTAAEAALVDRLTDLSGFLPPSTEVPSYLTLYPCGRFYAIARTWPDRSGTRSGTVLSHTLLVSSDEIGSIEILAPLLALHREPTDVKDRDPYKHTLEFADLAEPRWQTEPSDSVWEFIAAMLLGYTERPVVMVDADAHEDVVQRVWCILWPSARARFSTCTFALGVRRHDRSPFDLLFAPPAARAAFLEIAKTPTFWDRLQALPPKVPGVYGQPWFSILQTKGPKWRDELLDWCSSHSLPMVPVGLCARLERLRVLDGRSSEHITAARGRLDAIRALWPKLKGDHPYLERCVTSLVQHQPNAPDLPTPLRSLFDLVSRSEVLRVAQSRPTVLENITRVLQSETEARCIRNPSLAWPDLALFVDAATVRTWREALAVGVTSAIAKAPSADAATQWSIEALNAAPEFLREEIVLQQLFTALPRERQAYLAKLVVISASERLKSLLFRLLHFAIRQHDGRLEMDIYTCLGDRVRGIRKAMARILLIQGPRYEAGALAEGYPWEDRVTWCLSSLPQAWREFAAYYGARWAREHELKADTIVERCAAVEQGPLLVMHWIDDQNAREAEEVLINFPEFTVRLVVESLSGRAERAHPRAIEIAIGALPDTSFSATELLPALFADKSPRVADYLLKRFGPFVVSEVTNGRVPEQLLRLFDTPSGERWVGQIGVDEIGRLTDEPPGWAALPNVWSVFERLHEAASPGQRAALELILIAFVRVANMRALDATASAITAWIRNRTVEPFAERLAAELLVAVRSRGPSSTPVWIEACFRVVYPQIRRGERNAFDLTRWRPGDGQWDVARDWREWLAQTWLRHEYAPDGFLRTIDGDTRLLDEALVGVQRSWGNEEFVQSLLDAAEHRKQWRSYVPVLERWEDELRPWYKSKKKRRKD